MEGVAEASQPFAGAKEDRWGERALNSPRLTPNSQFQRFPGLWLAQAIEDRRAGAVDGRNQRVGVAGAGPVKPVRGAQAVG